MWLAACRLTLHEPVFYATREIGRLYETGRYLHNYALTYALGLAHAPFFCAEQVPSYHADLTPLNEHGVYVTPAQPLDVSFQLTTFKYGEEQLHVEMEQATQNTPSFGRAKELAPGSTFEFYVLSAQPRDLPRWIRLGKWHSKAEVVASQAAAQEQVGPFSAACALNPLDIPTGLLRTFDIVSMPPSSLVTQAQLVGPYYQLAANARRGLPIGMRYNVPALEPPRRPPRSTARS